MVFERVSFLNKIPLRGAFAAVLFALGAALIALQGALLVGCGGRGSDTPALAAPSTLTYATNPATYTKDLAIQANTPRSSGGAVASYSITPALPAGLTLSPTTGVITGTPTLPSPQTAYTVKATNAGGSTECYLLLAVNDLAPTGLSYPSPLVTYTRGEAIAPLMPAISGGAVTRYATSPALPSGLALDAATGVVSGTPTVVAAQATYRVTASNSGGSVTSDLTITVKDVPPSVLTYASNPATYVAGTDILPNRPSHAGGAVISYAIAPALPAGLAMDTLTGVINGRPAAPMAVRDYTVTAQNSGGATLCTLTLTVNAVAPTNLVYADSAPTYTRGVAIPANPPTHSGGEVTDYRISPTLPAGLSLDPVSGILSGTPSVISPAASFTVTATNSGGATTCQLMIAVREAGPSALVYATNPTAYTINQPIQPNLPSHGGGIITAFTVNPALPTGLSLDPVTGVISGTPTVLTPQATYLITGSNATDSTTCAFLTAVVASPIPPPAAPVLTAPAFASAGQTALQAATQDQGTANGTTYTWTLTNGLISGGQGTPAITFTAGAVGPLTLEVKVANLGGSATETRNVTVVAPPTAQLFTQDKVLYGTRVQASVANQADMSYLWTLSGPSAGTITSGTTNVLSYTAGLTPGAYQLAVNVQSPTGAETSATRTLEVVANQFLPDAQTSRQRFGHTLTVLLDGRMLVAGGDDSKAAPKPSADLYDPHSGTWAPTGPMAALRADHAAALLPDGRVLVVGGADPSGAMLATAEIFDPATKAWTSAPNMNATRQSASATTLPDGKVLVAGGFGLDSGGTEGGYLSSAEVYDPVANTWEAIDPMITPRAFHTATRLQNGMVLMAAGAKGTSLAGWVIAAERFDPIQRTWTSVGNLTTSRYAHTATLLTSGKVLVAGGRSVIGPITDGEVFDPATGTWAPTANKTGSGHSTHDAVLLPTGQVLVVGGSDDATLGKVDAYDPATNRWTAMTGLILGRTQPRAALLPTGKVLVVGGMGPVAPVTIGNAEIYDPIANTWSIQGMQNPSRSAHTTTKLQDGSLLVTGGTGAISYMASVERLDPATGLWTSASNLAKARCYHTASLLNDGMVLVAGGLATGGSATNTAERYNPATNSWTTVGNLAQTRMYHTATLLPNGKVLVVGGVNGATTLANAELFDPATGTWAAAASLATARYNHTATLLPNGKVLVAGGGTSSLFFSTTELYDPSTDSWAPGAPMFIPRMSPTATLLADGTVLIMGGQSNPNSGMTAVERYNPTTNVWTAQGSLNASRYLHAATLLPDGRVLVTGGRKSSFQTEATAELYNPGTETSTSLPMSVIRYYHTATVLDAAGTVLVLGGLPGSTPEFWKP